MPGDGRRNAKKPRSIRYIDISTYRNILYDIQRYPVRQSVQSLTSLLSAHGTTHFDLTPWACSVGTSLASQSSHLGTASLYCLADLSSGSLFSPSLLALWVLLFFFFRSVCVRLLRARHCGRARRRHRCQWVLANKGRVARGAVAAVVPRRRVCLETRGMHEWALSGPHL